MAATLFPFALFLFAQSAAFALFLALFAFPLALGDGAGMFGFVLGLFAFALVLLDRAFTVPKPVFTFVGLTFFHPPGVFFGAGLFPLGFALLGRRVGAFTARSSTATPVRQGFGFGSGGPFAPGVRASARVAGFARLSGFAGPT